MMSGSRPATSLRGTSAATAVFLLYLLQFTHGLDGLVGTAHAQPSNTPGGAPNSVTPPPTPDPTPVVPPPTAAPVPGTTSGTPTNPSPAPTGQPGQALPVNPATPPNAVPTGPAPYVSPVPGGPVSPVPGPGSTPGATGPGAKTPGTGPGTSPVVVPPPLTPYTSPVETSGQFGGDGRGEIKEIIIEQNTKTTDAMVRLIANVEVGDDWNEAKAEAIKRDMISSGLFKDARIYWDPVPGGIRLHIIAKDKFSWAAAPTFYWQPTNKGGGAGFAENNLFGENKKLLLYGQIATGDTYFIGAYIDPSIRGTVFRWAMDVYLRQARYIEYAIPTEYIDDPKAVRQSKLTYMNAGVKVGMKLWRMIGFDVRMRGAKVGFKDVKLSEGATPQDVTGDPNSTEISAPGKEGFDASTEFIFSIDRRADFFGIASGYRAGLSFEKSAGWAGSDFDYNVLLLSFDKYWRMGQNKRINLIWKPRFVLGKDLPFQQETKSGGTANRGWLNDQFRGDMRVSSNLEYSVPMFALGGISFRGHAFWDSSYTAFTDISETDTFRNYLPGSDRLGLAPLKNSVGLGLRLFAKQIVIPLLGVDVGYGLERGSYEIYMAIGLTD